MHITFNVIRELNHNNGNVLVGLDNLVYWCWTFLAQLEKKLNYIDNAWQFDKCVNFLPGRHSRSVTSAWMAALGGSTGGKPTLPVPNKNQGPINCVIVLCFLQILGRKIRYRVPRKSDLEKILKQDKSQICSERSLIIKLISDERMS